MNEKKAIFLDRDGTLNRDPGYVYKIEDFSLLPGVIEGLKILQDEFIFIIITNQSGIGRGYYSIDDFHAFNNHLVNFLAEKGIEIKKTYFCPHLKEEGCDCRKPNTKFINQAVSEFNINLKKSWMLGDHPSDVNLGTNAGCNTVFMLTGHGMEHYHEIEEGKFKPTLVAEDFLTAAKKMKELI
jgi:histidinol-phosphate phosphatase family protein